MFNHVWKLYLTLNCDSHYCPKPHSERYPVSFNFQPPPAKSFLTQVQSQFPCPEDSTGYCGAEFSHKPDDKAPHALNSKV